MKKHLTEEKGWVPKKILFDEASYTLYVQKTLNEKIDKLILNLRRQIYIGT